MQLRIRAERIQHQWSTEYIGGKVGITDEAIRLIETGQRKPSYNVLVKLEDLFGLTHRELFAAVPDAEPKTTST